jgi:predicted amidohydrolase YtcJ
MLHDWLWNRACAKKQPIGKGNNGPFKAIISGGDSEIMTILADTVFMNGNILTMNHKQPHAEAVAVKGGRIVWVGGNDESRVLIGSETKVVDWDGKTVLPGLNDSHMHLFVYGQSLTWVILNQVRSIAELKEKVAAKVKITPPGQVIMGRGWDQTLFAEDRFPDRYDLDDVAPEHPVALSRVCGHVTVVNSKALELAGIHADTPDPEGGEVQKDKRTGEPNGLLMETAKLLFTERMPKLTTAQRKEMIETAIDQALALGLTSVTTDDIRGNLIQSIAECMEIYHSIWQERSATLRVNLMVYQSALDELLAMGMKTGSGDETVRIGAMKIVQDGSLGARTGVLREPYANDPGNRGLPVHSQEKLNEWVCKGHSAGMQIGIHVIGDAASDACLDAFEKAQKQMNRENARHRLIHFSIVDNDLLARTKSLEVGADIQPLFVALNGKRVEEFLGTKRAVNTYAWKSMLDHGIPIAGGSDCPVVNLSPLQGIHSLVNRTVDTVPGMIFQPQERLSVEEAIYVYTMGSAYSTFEEEVKGSVECGKLADFTVLSDDPRKMPESIRDLKIEMTIVNGRVVYSP